MTDSDKRLKEVRNNNHDIAKQFARNLNFGEAAFVLALGVKVDGTGLHYTHLDSIPPQTVAAMLRDCANQLDPKN